MAVLLEAAGSSRISPAPSSPGASLRDRPGPVVMESLLEVVPTEEVLGVRAVHVGADMNDDVPGAARGWLDGLNCGFAVRHALVVGDHAIEGERDAPTRSAAPDVDVRDIYRGGLESTDLELDCQRGRGGGPGDRPFRGRRTNPVELEDQRCR